MGRLVLFPICIIQLMLRFTKRIVFYIRFKYLISLRFDDIMSSQICKHPLFRGISFFALIFFSLLSLLSLLSLVMPSYVSGQGTCDVPYSDMQYGIAMNYPSHFLNTGPDTTLQPPAWIASFAYQYGQGTAFLNRYNSLGNLEVDTNARIDDSKRVHPDNVPVNIPRNATLAGFPGQQFEYTYTAPNGEVWVSYTVLMTREGSIYEYNFLAPATTFNSFLNDIKCMTDSLQVR
jgi:hypothetical protein